MIERDLRVLLKTEWPHWCDWLEPRGNAGLGRPDWDILVDRQIASVELKIGAIVGKHSFKPEKIRPEQVSWHHRYYSGGGVSFFMIAESPSDIWLCGRIIDVTNNYKVWVFNNSIKLNMAELTSDIISFIRAARQHA